MDSEVAPGQWLTSDSTGMSRAAYLLHGSFRRGPPWMEENKHTDFFLYNSEKIVKYGLQTPTAASLFFSCSCLHLGRLRTNKTLTYTVLSAILFLSNMASAEKKWFPSSSSTGASGVSAASVWLHARCLSLSLSLHRISISSCCSLVSGLVPTVWRSGRQHKLWRGLDTAARPVLLSTAVSFRSWGLLVLWGGWWRAHTTIR